jgi:D-amino-acid dehydrogenase
MVKVLVLGAGVVGVSAAYYLNRAGHEVVVVDRRDGAGLETSFANAGHLCRATARPWASEAVPRMLIKEFGKVDAPYLLRLRADPAMWAWALAFLRRCTRARHRETAANLIRLAVYSIDSLATLRETEELAYDQAGLGILHLHRDDEAFERAAAEAEVGNGEGAFAPAVLDRAGCIRVEPALAQAGDQFAGGLHFGSEETGDAHLFTTALAQAAAARGVVFRYGVTVRALHDAGDAVTGAETDRGPITADAVVLSMGSYSAGVLRPLGLKLPIYPVKGYSATIPTTGYNGAPRLGIHDEARKIGISRLGDRLRAAGTAELAGYDNDLGEARARAILDQAMAIFPNAGDAAQAELWCGLRPMTPDNAPLLGHTRFRNLYLDTGHGSLGWTLACGSGRVIADIVSGRAPDIDLDGLTLDRFG